MNGVGAIRKLHDKILVPIPVLVYMSQEFWAVDHTIPVALPVRLTSASRDVPLLASGYILQGFFLKNILHKF